MRTPTSIRFGGHIRHDDEILLLFAVNDGTNDHVAAVAVEPFTREARFPHGLVEEGLSINDVIDDALLERARETVALLDAATTWHTMNRARLRAA